MNWLSLKSAALPYYDSLDEYWRQSPNLAGTIPTGPTGGRRKRWRDNQAAALLQQQQQAGGRFWGGFQSAAPLVRELEYSVLARDESGRLLLTPVESMAAYQTYSQTIMGVYRQFKHWVQAGVPYLIKMRLPIEAAAALNFADQGPEVAVPVEIGAGTILIPDGAGDCIVYLNYQDFLREARAPENWTVEERLQRIDQVRASGQPADAQFSAIRDICTIRGNSAPGSVI